MCCAQVKKGDDELFMTMIEHKGLGGKSFFERLDRNGDVRSHKCSNASVCGPSA